MQHFMVVIDWFICIFLLFVQLFTSYNSYIFNLYSHNTKRIQWEHPNNGTVTRIDGGKASLKFYFNGPIYV